MKYNLQSFLIAAALAFSPWVTTASGQETKTGYAMSDSGTFGKGIYTFELSDTIDNISLFQSMTYDAVTSGILLNDTYYYFEYSQVYNGTESIGFFAFDMETKTVRQIADYGAALNSSIAGCFSYNYQNETLYALNGFNGGDRLVKMDLDNGTMTDVGALDFDYVNEAAQASTVGEHMHVMTSTYDGDFYGVSYWGSLYKINPYTAACQYIGTLDYNPGQAFMYTSDCLFYDNDTDQLYLRYTTYDWSTYTWLYEVLMIDTKTAHVTRFANVPAQSSLNAICIPFTVASASAPAKVQNLVATRGEAGAFTATVEWDNPEKTYGRGGTLEDLDYVLVLRDGELVDSIVNPVIGGHQSWTDNNITERGYYTYKIIPGNDMGRGDRASVGIYIGKGDPMTVTDVVLEQEGDGAKLSWTAPVEGKFESYIDTSTLNYNIIRYKDSSTEGETIATGCKETTYTDNSISEMATYSYSIVANTDNASSDAVTTDAMILGPAFALPHTFEFNSSDEFNLWTVIDANGNYSTWTWSQGYYGYMKGATCSYYYDETPAADWLISPRIKFEAGKRYKVTFDAQPGSKKVMETLAVSFGQGTEIADQDSVSQFDIVSDSQVSLRANLPVVSETGDYNVGFLYRSYYTNYNLTIGNIAVSEDHEGYVEGVVSVDGKPIEGALVYTNAGEFNTLTAADGSYKLNYLPEGDYTLTIVALGYEDASAQVSVTEYETSVCNVSMTALPAYTVKGKVVDIAGDPVANASVAVSGYNTYETVTASDGTFTIESVYKNPYYTVDITKNKLIDAQVNFGVDADTDLGEITLLDNHKPAGKVSVEATDDAAAEVTWKAPANDAVVQRIDDGTVTTAVGISGASSNTMFGVVKREPSTVTGVEFYIDGTSSITHYSVRLNIFNLDENGEPTDSLLYQNTYVSATDGQWNSYTLPAPVDAPNGYYIALSYYDYLLVGIDGAGDSEKYPFVEGVNCFTPDYTTGVYYYLEGQSNTDYHHNFLIRPIAAPHYVDEDSTEFKNNAARFIHSDAYAQQSGIELESKTYTEEETKAFADSEAEGLKKTPQSRIRYNVYRMKAADMADESKWTIVSEKQQARNFSDTDWSSLEQGSYAYAVKAVYTGDTLATASVSDSIGNKMYTKVTYRLVTNTPDNEAYGAKVQMVAGGGLHVATGYADENGNVVLDGVWKDKYDLTITLDGFKTIYETVDVSAESEYTFDYIVEEDQITPYNLIIDDGGNSTSKLFIWNYPDLFEDSFEEHEDFAINSPGTIGWQYVDGDGAETGGFSGYTWDNAFAPMAYMVFNAKNTTPSVYDYFYGLRARTGDKCLTDWAAYGVQNDDWIITPKLYFQEDFIFSFYAASYDYSYLESFEVAYSTTDANPESFIILQDSMTAYSYWEQYAFSIPKEAKYVAIHCISDQMRIFRIDDVSYGLESAMSTPSYIRRLSARRKSAMKAPSLDGLYEVYLDGEKVAQQDETTYTFTGLSAGKHTAGVIASYTSGKTEMSTIDFSIDATGITSLVDNKLKVAVDNRKLTVEGDYDSITLYSVSGAAQHLNKTGEGVYNLNNIPSGVYVVNVYADGNVKTMKVTIK
ncbi:MAG: carboxypeptidase regulatory-like domain-containing protein [Prevotellaceae bacterium]|nr:carboxypeptidase regulatory-like domain-containing protein [Prevotellaceae bacterium]